MFRPESLGGHPERTSDLKRKKEIEHNLGKEKHQRLEERRNLK